MEKGLIMDDVTTFDDLDIGQTWPPYEYQLTDEFVSTYRSAVRSEDGGVQFDGSDNFPPLALDTLSPIKATVRMPEGTLHAQEAVTFSGLPAKGEQVSVTLTVKDKYVKRSRKFVVVVQETRGSDGRLLLTAEKTFVWPQ
jgi:3-hydroxybutyryl-CoA dehydratase